MAPKLSPTQWLFLNVLAGATEADSSHVSGGFHRTTWLRYGFKAPTAEACERLGLVKVGYDDRFGVVTAKLTEAGKVIAVKVPR